MEREKVCLVGLGYVGLPLAALLSTKHEVIGFDIKEERIRELRAGKDSTGEVENIGDFKIDFTSDPSRISEAGVIIVAVPTPIDSAKNPDLKPVISASTLVGKNLKSGMVVIYESTVYPGCTEGICLPILEKESGLKCGNDFKIGYSPERVNPGDKEHTIDKIVKVVSGSDSEALERISRLYGSVVAAGVHQVSSLKVAEAAKVIENTKRDLNISLVNELSLIFERMGIDTREVLKAAGTKWNFNSGEYFPGLVGGHCIGVDPYYLTNRAIELGYYPQVILAGRSVNEFMSQHVVNTMVKSLSSSGKVLKDCRVAIMGLTFKENVPDTRNSKVVDIIRLLREFGIKVFGCDPLLDGTDTERDFPALPMIDLKSTGMKFDGIIVFSPHREFKELSFCELRDRAADQPVLIDLKSFYNRAEAEAHGFTYKTL